MGADRAVLVSDDAAAGPTSSRRARRSRRRSSGRRRPRPLRPGVGRRRRGGALGGRRGPAAQARDLAGCRALVRRRRGQGEAPDRARVRHDLGAVARGRRRLGRDQRAALPVAQGDHGREVEAAGDSLRGRPRARRRRPRRGGLEDDRARARAAALARRHGEDRGRRQRAQKILDYVVERRACEVPRLPRAPRRRAREGRPRRARQGGVARRGGGRRPRRGRRRGGRGRGRVRRGQGVHLRGRRASAPLPQPRVDALAALVETSGADAVLFGASVLSADVAAGSPRGSMPGSTGT